jgi:triacylglycerol lipase
MHDRATRMLTSRRLVGAATTVAVAGLAAWGLGRARHAMARYYAETPAPGVWFHEDERPAFTPAWRELGWTTEWLRLRLSAVYRGKGVSQGSGSAVILVPGFLARPLHLAELCGWLRRIGYHASIADLGWNADCFEVNTDRLLAQLGVARRQTGRGVHLVGHSLGGILARSAAVRRSDAVASLTTLGSPVRGLRDHPILIALANRVRRRIHAARRSSVRPACLTFACDCETVRALAEPPGHVPELAVYSREDGLVDWRYCVTDDPTRDREVGGTHLGLPFNADAYAAIAEHLHRAEGKMRDAAALSREAGTL